MDGRWTSGFSETFSHVFDRPQRFAARHSRLRRHFIRYSSFEHAPIGPSAALREFANAKNQKEKKREQNA